MSSARAHGAPAWQTDELQDEWPDSGDEEEEEDDGNNMSYGTQSVSFTVPLSTQIHTTADFEPDPTPSSHRNYPAGTFLVREEIEHAPLLPKTPGANNKKGAIKDFFTPMPLERMFEPPSPPIQQQPDQNTQDSTPSRVADAIPDPNLDPPSQSLEDEIVETDMPNMSSFHGRKPTLACQFTFSVPRPNGGGNAAFAQAQSTPNPPLPRKTNGPPPTDPRLRLFQFQYDTYTREHLSALVDSIAVNTPSGPGTGTTATPTSFGQGLSRVSEASVAPNMSHLRSNKRLKLSPSSDLCVEAPQDNISIARPKIFGKDYVGESRNLMQQIKLARDFSTISSVASGQNNSPSYEHINDSHGNALTSKNASTPCKFLFSVLIEVDTFTSHSSQCRRDDPLSSLYLIKILRTLHPRLVPSDRRLIPTRLFHIDKKPKL